MTSHSLAVIELSDSFRTAWQDLADELGVHLASVSPVEAPGPDSIAVLLAAGGEEDRALDLLPSLPRPDGVPVFLVGAQTSHRFAVEAIRRGAADYFAFPGDLNLLRRTLSARVEARRRKAAVATTESEVTQAFSELLGQSPALSQTLDQATRVARHGNVTVLIQGETGTGKELLARALHAGGRQPAAPFVAVNCAAIPGELMESELFGHERGAFTDAHASKPGLFEEADGGTLFLDEVGHLPLRLQGKLLRALEEHRIRRVGATQSRDIDVRIIAATHVDLIQAVQEGTFRDDLFYRLNVITLTLPPLRDRGADVEVLAKAFLAALAERYELPMPELSNEARVALHTHPWPGNVRELRHAIERSLLLSEPGTLDPVHFTPRRSAERSSASAPIPFPATLDQVMAAAAQAAMRQHDGNKSAAARQLGISRARLARLLELGED